MRNHNYSCRLAFALIALGFAFFSCNNNQALKAPEENRFVKTVLNQGDLFEPTEMAILPNLDVLILQRRGQIMKYDQQSKKLKQVGYLDVYYKALTPGGSTEDGLLGITADPDFATNHFIYIYYAPSGDRWVDRLSRFEFKDDTIDIKTEKVVLEVKTQREICCHTGGSLTFGNEHQLFLSTGDNSTPFDEAGQKYPTHSFGPMDDRPGHQAYDSRRTAANSNDLRGKILRIQINSDGTYTIPKDNLFPKGEPKTRPEIYIMGDRNPYRISYDKNKEFLYWGEVGPDALADSFATRGPMGYDEINQARQAGNFGWPLFEANNQAYNRHNYQTNADGAAYDPAHPMNASRNNTGLMFLPPAQPAFIWYPYGVSKEFPQLGSGGRTALAGPVYNYDDYDSETRYPEYYDGKLFIYDFIRGWIKAVTMQPNGDYIKMESFMEHTKFNGMLDMEVGPDGRIYVLEYGNGWFTKNPEAALSRIDYLPGNRPPAVSNFTVNRTTGNLPFVLNATVKAVDPENDPMTYVWSIGGVKMQSDMPSLHYTISQPGDYDISVEVFDRFGASTKSNVIPIYAGNERPKADIVFKGGPNFYFPGKPVNYQVMVTDNGAQIDQKNLDITVKYVNLSDIAGGPILGDQMVPATILGKNLMLSLDCKSCHKIDQTSIGPAFKLVAKRYAKNPDAMLFLPQKIIKGGSGHWGEVAMSAHPALKETDASQIVEWILSLADSVPKTASLPLSGTIVPMPDVKQPQNTVFSLNVTYTDDGEPGIRALSTAKTAYLRSNVMDASEMQDINGFAFQNKAGNTFLTFPTDTGHFTTGNVDLSGIGSIELTGFGNGKAADYQIEIVADKEVGGLAIGKADMLFKADKKKITAGITLQKPADNKAHNYYLVFKQTSNIKTGIPVLKTLRFVPAK